MDIKAVARGRTLPGNKGGFTNSNGNVFHRNTNVSRALSGDPSKKSSNVCLKNSSVSTTTREKRVCKYWMSGHCGRGDKCWYLHSWSRGAGFAMLAKLEGHKKVFFIGHWILGINNRAKKFWLTNFYMFSSITGGSRGCPSFRVWQALFWKQWWNCTNMGLQHWTVCSFD